MEVLEEQAVAPEAAGLEEDGGGGGAEAAGNTIETIQLSLDARAWDLAGERVDADLTATIAAIIAAVGEDTVRLDDTRLDVELGRRGQFFDVRNLLTALASPIPIAVELPSTRWKSMRSMNVCSAG